MSGYECFRTILWLWRATPIPAMARRGLPVLRRTRVYGVRCSSSLDAVRQRQPEPHAAIRQTAVERDRIEAPARDSPLDRIIGSPRDLRRDRRLSRRSY